MIRYIPALLVLLAGCFIRGRTSGQCLINTDAEIIQVVSLRGLTMMYVRTWNAEDHTWSGQYPVDTWEFLTWQTVMCPLKGIK